MIYPFQQFYQCFDGFVILHGTDTLAYTSSALSFMLENLGKTVIVTGSQIPIFETRTDGRDNFTSALIIAGNYTIPEVCVLFGAKLIRGNRATKMNTSSLDAFESPNCPPIAKIGINVEVDYRSIFRPCNDLKFSAHTNLNENVALLRLFPSISTAAIKAALQPPIEGVVLQTFGSGNIPSIRKDLMQELKLAAERGVIIVNCTQCNVGSVAGIYQTGAILSEIGILPGFDMTPEAALTKLAYVLGKETWSLDMKKQVNSNLWWKAHPESKCYSLLDDAIELARGTDIVETSRNARRGFNRSRCSILAFIHTERIGSTGSNLISGNGKYSCRSRGHKQGKNLF